MITESTKWALLDNKTKVKVVWIYGLLAHISNGKQEITVIKSRLTEIE